MMLKLLVLAAAMAAAQGGNMDMGMMQQMMQMMGMGGQQGGSAGGSAGGSVGGYTGGSCADGRCAPLPEGVDVQGFIQDQKEKTEAESARIQRKYEAKVQANCMKKQRYTLTIMTEFASMCACLQSYYEIHQSMFVQTAMLANMTDVTDYDNYQPYDATTHHEAKERIFKGMLFSTCQALGEYMEFVTQVENELNKPEPGPGPVGPGPVGPGPVGPGTPAPGGPTSGPVTTARPVVTRPTTTRAPVPIEPVRQQLIIRYAESLTTLVEAQKCCAACKPEPIMAQGCTDGNCPAPPVGVDIQEFMRQQTDATLAETHRIQAKYDAVMKQTCMRKNRYALSVMTEFTSMCSCMQSAVEIYQSMFVQTAMIANMTDIEDVDGYLKPYKATTIHEAKHRIFKGMLFSTCKALGEYMEFAAQVETHLTKDEVVEEVQQVQVKLEDMSSEQLNAKMVEIQAHIAESQNCCDACKPGVGRPIGK